MTKTKFIKKKKILNDEQKQSLKQEIKMLMHASRDCLRNRNKDTSCIKFDIHDAYFGEAFGILRAIKVLGYGKFGAVNDPSTLNFWFTEIEQEVLKEENYNGSNECNFCLEHYGKDGAGRVRGR